jgi:hypothetical protein
MPRSGTTVIADQLAYRYNLENLGEAYTEQTKRLSYGNIYQWTADQVLCVITLLANNLKDIDNHQQLINSKFSGCLVVKRQNLAECCISLYYAEQQSDLNRGWQRKYHYTQPPVVMPFACDLDFVNRWIKLYKEYQQFVQLLDADQIVYEDYMNNQTLTVFGDEFNRVNSSSTIRTVPAQINYSQVCTNYLTVQELIKPLMTF